MFRTVYSLLRQPTKRSFSSVAPKFGLTEQEIIDLQANWKVISSAPIPSAKIVFKDLFERHPDYQKKFKKYNSRIPLIHQNEFIPHMRAVIFSLSKIVNKLEDEAAVDNVLSYVASSHVGNNVGLQEMEDIGVSLKKTLVLLNKKKSPSEVEATFDKFWKAFLKGYMEKLQVANPKK